LSVLPSQQQGRSRREQRITVTLLCKLQIAAQSRDRAIGRGYHCSPCFVQFRCQPQHPTISFVEFNFCRRVFLPLRQFSHPSPSLRSPKRSKQHSAATLPAAPLYPFPFAFSLG
jgi:hypothetical protein